MLLHSPWILGSYFIAAKTSARAARSCAQLPKAQASNCLGLFFCSLCYKTVTTVIFTTNGGGPHSIEPILTCQRRS